MFEFFDDLAPENEERLSDKRADKIKTCVLSRIEEDKPMKKHFRIKPFVIAAAITATGAASVVTANAATDGAVVNGLSKTFSFFINGEEVSGTITAYEKSDGTVTCVELDIPDGALSDDTVGYIVLDEDESDNITVTPIESEGLPVAISFDEDNFTAVWESPEGLDKT